MPYKKFVLENLRSAAKIASDNFEKVKSIEKGTDNNQVLTQADIDIGNLLVSQITKHFPDHNVIDEEAGIINRQSNFTWVVDPIDGTSNFANGIPMYGIMLGLLNKNIPVVGGVALPTFQEFYYAERGQGAYRNDRQIKVTDMNDLLKCLVVYALDGHQENPELTHQESKLLADIVLNIRNLRSSNSCFDIMMVASGKYGAWLNRTSKIWDNVAPQVIIQEAGGVYTNFIGKPIDYSNPLNKSENNFTVCASSPLLHRRLQEIIQQHDFTD